MAANKHTNKLKIQNYAYEISESGQLVQATQDGNYFEIPNESYFGNHGEYPLIEAMDIDWRPYEINGTPVVTTHDVLNSISQNIERLDYLDDAYTYTMDIIEENEEITAQALTNLDTRVLNIENVDLPDLDSRVETLETTYVSHEFLSNIGYVNDPMSYTEYGYAKLGRNTNITIGGRVYPIGMEASTGRLGVEIPYQPGDNTITNIGLSTEGSGNYVKEIKLSHVDNNPMLTYTLTVSYATLPTLSVEGKNTGTAPNGRVIDGITVNDHKITYSYVSIPTYSYAGLNYVSYGYAGLNYVSYGYAGLNYVSYGYTYAYVASAYADIMMSVDSISNDYLNNVGGDDTSGYVIGRLGKNGHKVVYGYVAVPTYEYLRNEGYVYGAGYVTQQYLADKSYVYGTGYVTQKYLAEKSYIYHINNAPNTGYVIGKIGQDGQNLTYAYVAVPTYEYLKTSGYLISSSLDNYVTKPNAIQNLYLGVNESTFVMTLSYTIANDPNTTKTNTFDFPLESVVVNGYYNSGFVHLELKNGNYVRFSVSDLVNGLVSTDDLNNAGYLTSYTDSYINKFTTSATDDSGFKVSYDYNTKTGSSFTVSKAGVGTYGVVKAYQVSTISANTLKAYNGKNYPVSMTANGYAYVAVPWTDTNDNTYTYVQHDTNTRATNQYVSGITISKSENGDKITYTVHASYETLPTIPDLSVLSYLKSYSYTNSVSKGTNANGFELDFNQVSYNVSGNVTSKTNAFNILIPGANDTSYGLVKSGSGDGKATIANGIITYTDSKVTSAENHYTPSGTDQAITAGTGSNLTFGGKVVSEISYARDNKGHVTSISYKLSTLPSETSLNVTGTKGTNNVVVDVKKGTNSHDLEITYGRVPTYDDISALSYLKSYSYVGFGTTTDNDNSGFKINLDKFAYNVSDGTLTRTANAKSITIPKMDNNSYGVAKAKGGASGTKFVGISSDGFLTYTDTDNNDNTISYVTHSGSGTGNFINGITVTHSGTNPVTYTVTYSYGTALTSESISNLVSTYYDVLTNGIYPATNALQVGKGYRNDATKTSSSYSAYSYADIYVPYMTSSQYGVAKLGYATTLTIGNEVYGVGMTSDGKLAVNVPSAEQVQVTYTYVQHDTNTITTNQYVDGITVSKTQNGNVITYTVTASYSTLPSFANSDTYTYLTTTANGDYSTHPGRYIKDIYLSISGTNPVSYNMHIAYADLESATGDGDNFQYPDYDNSSAFFKISTAQGDDLTGHDLYIPTMNGGTGGSYGVAKAYHTRYINEVPVTLQNPDYSDANRNYGVSIDNNGKLFVNVPWIGGSLSLTQNGPSGTVVSDIQLSGSNLVITYDTVATGQTITALQNAIDNFGARLDNITGYVEVGNGRAIHWDNTAPYPHAYVDLTGFSVGGPSTSIQSMNFANSNNGSLLTVNDGTSHTAILPVMSNTSYGVAQANVIEWQDSSKEQLFELQTVDPADNPSGINNYRVNIAKHTFDIGSAIIDKPEDTGYLFVSIPTSDFSGSTSSGDYVQYTSGTVSGVGPIQNISVVSTPGNDANTLYIVL